MRIPIHCLCLSLGIPLVGQAPEGSSWEKEPEALIQLLNTPVKSASKREQKLLEAPQAMEVITRRQIQRMGVFRLQDVLLQATSVNLLKMDPINTYAGIRGNLTEGYPKNIQVLIDGVPFYNSVRGAVDLDNLPIPLALIEKIEIVRGPSSPLYGAGAVGGVIAIYTRKATEISASARFGAGEDKRYYSADLTRRIGPLNFSFGFDGGTGRESGFPYRPLGDVVPFFQPTPAQYEQLREDAFHQHRMLFRSEYTSGASIFSLSAGRAEKKTGNNFGSGFVIPYERFTNDFAKLGWERAWTDAFRTELSVHALDILAVTGDFTKPESDVIDYSSKQVSLQVNADPLENLHLVAGWDARNSRASSVLGGPIRDARDQAWGVFLVVDWTFIPSWDLSLGGRHERDSMGGARSSPRAVLSWHWRENSSLRFGYHTSARSPQVLEARIAATRPSLIIPNPDLKFEKTDSLELGYRQSWQGWTFDLTLFDMAFEDLIARMTILPTPPPSGTRQYVNVTGTARNKGLELALQKVIGFATVGANATVLSFKDQEKEDYVYTPKCVANLFARFSLWDLNGFVGLNYVGPHSIGNYLGAPTFEENRAKLRGRFNLNYDLSERFTVSVFAQNLGARHDAHGAGGSLQSPILRGSSREMGASIGLYW